MGLVAHTGAARDKPPPTVTQALTSPQRPSIGLIVLLGALTAIPSVATSVYVPAMPQMTADLHTSANAAAQTFSVFFLGNLFGQFVFGPWSDRVGRRPPLFVGQALYIAASLGCALAPSIGALIGFRFLQAFGGCAAMTIARTVVRDRYAAHDTARVLAYLALVFGASPIFGPLLGGALLLFGDWRSIFYLMAAFGVICTAGSYFFLPESLSAEHLAHAKGETPLQSFKSLARDPAFLAYVLPGALVSGLLLSYIAVSPDLFVRGYGFSEQAFSLLVAANGVAFVAAGQLNAFLLRRRIPYSDILRWASLSCVGFALLQFFFAFTSIGGPWAIEVTVFFLMANGGFVSANAMAGALNAQSNRAGAAASLAGVALGACGALAAATTGFLHDGSAMALAAVSLTCASIGAIALRVFRAMAQRQARFAASNAALKPDSENS